MKKINPIIAFIVVLFSSIAFSPLLSFAQGNNMSNPIVMGNYSAGSFTYNDSRNNSGYGNDYGQPSEDIFYKF